MQSSVLGPARLRRVATVVLLVGVSVAAGPARAAWAEGAESISRYDVTINVAADATMRVTETITYDFGNNERHGIMRDIPVRVHVDDTHDRVYPIDAVSATMDGSAVPFEQGSDGGDELLRVGDPDKTIRGEHTFVLAYTVRGALNGFADHDELYWDVVGDGWAVPIASATATVTGPAGIIRIDCFAGPSGGPSSCDGRSVDGVTAGFGPQRLASHTGLTVVVAFPSGSVGDTAPLLAPRRDAAAAFRATPLTVGLGGALALLGVAAVLLLAWLVGRDRRYVGLLPGLSPGFGESAVERRRPLFGTPPVSVEFGPPEKIRPGQVGTMIDERADPRDVTASIVDLAVRRHLYIKEVDEEGVRDWDLVKLTDGDPDFLPYEKTLFEALFADRDRVRLSELRGTVAGPVRQARQELYQDMVDRGWYRRSPADTRRRGYLLAGFGVLAAAVATVVLALVHLGLIGIGLIVAALALVAVAGLLPARTGRGSAVLARIQGFRLYVATAEAKQLEFQERAQIFSTFLPYAIVFGLVDRWAATFADQGLFEQEEGVYWYGGPGPFTYAWFHGSFGGFTTGTAMVGTAVAAASGSSAGTSGFSGGFAGGGAGGGGGGSW